MTRVRLDNVVVSTPTDSRIHINAASNHLVWPNNALSRQTAAAILEIIAAIADENATPSVGKGVAS